MELALYQPDIAANTGALARLSTCWNVPLHIIHPCGFVWNDEKLKRAGMDYLTDAPIIHHDDWDSFFVRTKNQRLLLLTTKAEVFYVDFSFEVGDILLLGRESSGVPEAVHQAVAHRLKIPTASSARSLNVAMAGAIVLSEGLRQTNGHPS